MQNCGGQTNGFRSFNVIKLVRNLHIAYSVHTIARCYLLNRNEITPKHKYCYKSTNITNSWR